jgi:myo-inositol-1(or 4)-monophosphatase
MSAPNEVQWNRGDRDGLLGIAITAAEGAAAVIRSRAAETRAVEWRMKSPADFVSDVDTAAEATIREVILRDAPGAVVIAEEGSPDVALAEAPTFVVDPLDGTTNFLHGYPSYAVSIAVLVARAPLAAVIVNVATHEVFTATAGGGAWCDGASLRVSEIADPARALVGTGFPFKHLHLLDAYQRQFAAVMRHTSGIRRAGSAALDLTDVARGRFDAFWELVLMPWDFAAGALLVREAGGAVTTPEGLDPPLASSAIVAGNRAMHRWMLDILSGTRNGERGTEPSGSPFPVPRSHSHSKPDLR